MVEEEERLEELLHAQKEVVVYDFKLLKEEFKPTTHAINNLGKMVTRERGNVLVNAAAGQVIDLVLKKGILGRAGWATRILIPAMLKNYTSHFVEQNKEGFLKKIASWIGKKNHNGKAAPELPEKGISDQ